MWDVFLLMTFLSTEQKNWYWAWLGKKERDPLQRDPADSWRGKRRNLIRRMSLIVTQERLRWRKSHSQYSDSDSKEILQTELQDQNRSIHCDMLENALEILLSPSGVCKRLPSSSWGKVDYVTIIIPVRSTGPISLLGTADPRCWFLMDINTVDNS